MLDRVKSLSEGYVAGGRYEVLRLIGEGGMGSVYEALDRNVEKRVAIKFLNPDLTESKEFAKRFRREACAAAAIRHENICDVTDYGLTEKGIPFLVMEYLEGIPLTKLLDRRGKLPMTEALPLALQVLDALGAVHDAGIIHRDLKPDNIFVSSSARGVAKVKLIDFGIAKITNATSTATVDGNVLGTVHYMAPEQAAGEVDRIDLRTDLWAVGVILYEMLSGTLPFVGDTLREVLGAIIFKDPKPVSSFDRLLPVELGAAIQRALSKEKEDRFESALHFALALEAVLASAGVPVDGRALRRIDLEQREDEEEKVIPRTISQSSKPSHPIGPADASFVSVDSARVGVSGELLVGYPPGTPTESIPSTRRWILIAVILVAGAAVALTGLAVVALSMTKESSASRDDDKKLPSTSQPASVAVDAAMALPGDASPESSDDEPVFQLSKIVLTGVPEGADVTFRGVAVTDNTLSGHPGEAGELVVRAEGYQERREDVTFDEREVLDHPVRLERRPPASGRRRRPVASPQPQPTVRQRPVVIQPPPPPRGTAVRGGWESGGVRGGWE